MDRIDHVDLSAALLDIARNNTFYHLEFDLNISLGQMERAATLDDPAEKTLIWVSYPSGIDCYSERQAFQKDTRDYNGVQFHGKEARRERRLAYAVEVTGLENGKPQGNLFQIDIGRYAETVRQGALTSQTMRLYTDAGQIIMPKDEYDERFPLDLPKMSYYRNEPDDPAALQALMDTARTEREAACIPGDLWLHTSNLYDERRAFYVGQLLGDLGKQREPNSPDGRAFSVELDARVANAYGPQQLLQLLEALPFDNAMFAVQKGQHDMRLVVPREEVLRQRRAERELRGKLQQAADYIVWEGSQNTTQGNWIMGFDNFPPEIGDAAFIAAHQKEILGLLERNTDVVADAEIIGDSFDVCYCLAYCPNAEIYEDEEPLEPDKVHGYAIEESVLFPSNRGFALAENPAAPQPFVTWQFTEENGTRDYYSDRYFQDRDKAFADFEARAGEHMRDYGPLNRCGPSSEQKPSVLVRLQEGKKAAAQGDNPPKTAPKRDSGLEV